MSQNLFNLPYQPATSIQNRVSLTSSFIFNGPQTLGYTGALTYTIVINTSDSMGNFSVQGSFDGNTFNDIPLGSFQAQTFDIPAGKPITQTLAASATPASQAASDTITITLFELPYAYTQLVYTSTTAGTGSCEISVTQ